MTLSPGLNVISVGNSDSVFTFTTGNPIAQLARSLIKT